MSQACQLLCGTCVCVSVCACECVFHGSTLGCGSLSSPAAAVTQYSTYTFLLLIQASLLATIFGSVELVVKHCRALLNRRTCNQHLMNTVCPVMKDGYMHFDEVDLLLQTLI